MGCEFHPDTGEVINDCTVGAVGEFIPPFFNKATKITYPHMRGGTRAFAEEGEPVIASVYRPLGTTVLSVVPDVVASVSSNLEASA